MRVFTALMIMVLIGWSASDFAQAQQANSCKQCSDQRHACTGGYSAKTCQVEYERCMKTVNANDRQCDLITLWNSVVIWR